MEEEREKHSCSERGATTALLEKLQNHCREVERIAAVERARMQMEIEALRGSNNNNNNNNNNSDNMDHNNENKNNETSDLRTANMMKHQSHDYELLQNNMGDGMGYVDRDNEYDNELPPPPSRPPPPATLNNNKIQKLTYLHSRSTKSSRLRKEKNNERLKNYRQQQQQQQNNRKSPSQEQQEQGQQGQGGVEHYHISSKKQTGVKIHRSGSVDLMIA